MDFPKLQDASIEHGTRVLLRAGFNVPMNERGAPADVYRLRKALPTIEYLAERGAQTVIVAHLGRDGDSLAPVVSALQNLTSVPLHFFAGEVSEAAGQSVAPGECLVLENIRRNPGEERNDPALAQALAKLGDIFINDAFADSHRAHASVVGVAALMPGFAGFLMQEEIMGLTPALMPPSGSVAIVGGAKFETKEPLIVMLLKNYAHVCVGGALGNDFLKARGINVAASLISSTAVPPALAEDPRIALPTDVRVSAAAPHIVPVEEVAPDERMVDAGPQTIAAWSELIATAPLVLWNGPLGIYEQGFTQGTDDLAQTIARHCEGENARAIVGGGDTIAALENISFDEQKIFRSTGGGAMLEFLAQGTLPGIAALKR